MLLKPMMLVCICLLGVLSAKSDPLSLRAGTAKTDITPPPGVPMWGYESRKAPAIGTLDPLLARVMVLEVGEKRIALVTLDLGRTFGPASLERLRGAAKQTSGVAYIFVTASHTHGSPVILDEYPNGTVPAWETAALEKINLSIKEASQHLQDARIGTGFGVSYIGHNRLRQNSDGTVTWFDRNPTQVPTSPVDPTVSVMRIDTLEGTPLAILVNYACHPVIFGPDNLQFSADFPAAMTKTVEDAFANKPLCLFLQGAAGDINPFYAVTPLKEDAFAMRQWTGQHLGEEAVRVARAIRTEPAASASLDFWEDSQLFRLRWDPEQFRQGLIELWGPDAFNEFGPPIKTEMRLPVSIILINKRIALLGMPGEPFVGFQIDWRARCPVHDAFFVGYTNGYHGYFPTIRASTMKIYGAAGVTSWVEPGAAEQMLNHALIRIYEALGQLSRVPIKDNY